MGTVPEASGGEQAPIVASEAAPAAGSAAPATPTSGLLVVDKPRGVTSHDIVAAARGALHMKKVGHAGTLDPMATGVLVVGFGNATRLLNHIVEHDKTYEATIRLGQSTTTDDADGELLSATSPERWQELLALPVAGGPQYKPIFRTDAGSVRDVIVFPMGHLISSDLSLLYRIPSAELRYSFSGATLTAVRFPQFKAL